MTDQQLPLPLPDATGLQRHLPARLRPMQPTPIDDPFDDADYFFEPWWPGARAHAFAESGALRLQVAGLSDALAAFPELEGLPAQLVADGVVLDGTLLVLDGLGRPDGELLRARLRQGRAAPAGGRPAYVASDLLWSDGETWMRRPFRQRRARLEAVLPDGDRAVVGHGYEREGTLVAEALADLGIDGLSARRLDALHRSGQAGDAWLRASITPRAPRPRPTLALIQRLPLGEG